MDIRKIKIFTDLSLRRKILVFLTLLISLSTFFQFKYFKRTVSFGRNRIRPLSNQRVDIKLVKDIGFAINLVAKYTPWENVCRHQAYQAKILCKLFGLSYLIEIGFRRNEKTNLVEGHAWTIVSESMITGFCNPEDYQITSKFSN